MVKTSCNIQWKFWTLWCATGIRSEYNAIPLGQYACSHKFLYSWTFSVAQLQPQKYCPVYLPVNYTAIKTVRGHSKVWSTYTVVWQSSWHVYSEQLQLSKEWALLFFLLRTQLRAQKLHLCFCRVLYGSECHMYFHFGAAECVFSSFVSSFKFLLYKIPQATSYFRAFTQETSKTLAWVVDEKDDT